MADSPMTLSEHLARQQTSLAAAASPAIAANIATIVGRIGRVAVDIADELAPAARAGRLGTAGGTNVTGDQVKKLDVWGHEAVVAALRETRVCAAVISEEAPDPVELPVAERGSALVVCNDPGGRSSNLDRNGAGGPIFPLRASEGKTPAGPVALGGG